MSVYTTVERAALVEWLAPLALGELIAHVGISAGMQNSNYFVDTTRGRFVLTLFEHLPVPAVESYLHLMHDLAGQGLPCPCPCGDQQSGYCRPLAGKPAALLTCLPGQPLEQPSLAACRQVGQALARLHLAAAGRVFPPNPCGVDWMQATGATLLPLVSRDEAVLLASELDFQRKQAWTVAVGDDLPAGVIHGDLFRDNVLWDGAGQLSGLLDFYFAGVDAWLFDLAVVVNDWCSQPAQLVELVAAYHAIRPLTVGEQSWWPVVQRAAALRFWLLRLDAWYRPRCGEVVTRKDPGHFARMLHQLRQASSCLPL